MREVVAWARELFGGNGIVLDCEVAKFFAAAEALYSFERSRGDEHLDRREGDHGDQRLRARLDGPRV